LKLVARNIIILPSLAFLGLFEYWRKSKSCTARSCIIFFKSAKNVLVFKHIFIKKFALNFFYTGGPRYMRSFYLRFRVYMSQAFAEIRHFHTIQKWPFFWNLSSNYQSSLVFLYANSLYLSLFLEFLSLAFNEVQLYLFFFILRIWPFWNNL
jgi:hypothetical protein